MKVQDPLLAYFGERLLRPLDEDEIKKLSKIELFAIVFSNRSGSTLLADSLYRRGLPIPPQVEILDPILVEHVSRSESKATFTDYFLDTVFGWADSGVCGFKLGLEQLRWLEETGLLARFKSHRLLHISRQDKVAQAVSLYIARSTGQWHHAMQSAQSVQNISYSADGIRAALGTILDMEADIASYIASKQPPLKQIYYEDLISDSRKQLQDCCEFLGWRESRSRKSDDAVPPLVAQRTALNDAFVEQFLRDPDGA